jgi:hypothetical protein
MPDLSRGKCNNQVLKNTSFIYAKLISNKSSGVKMQIMLSVFHQKTEKLFKLFVLSEKNINN